MRNFPGPFLLLETFQMTDFLFYASAVFFVMNTALFIYVFMPVLFGLTDHFKSPIYYVGLMISIFELIGGVAALFICHRIYGGVFFQAILYLIFAAYVEFADWKDDKEIHVLYR